MNDEERTKRFAVKNNWSGKEIVYTSYNYSIPIVGIPEIFSCEKNIPAQVKSVIWAAYLENYFGTIIEICREYQIKIWFEKDNNCEYFSAFGGSYFLNYSGPLAEKVLEIFILPNIPNNLDKVKFGVIPDNIKWSIENSIYMELSKLRLEYILNY